MGEIADTLRRVANGLPLPEIIDTEDALAEVIPQLSAILVGVNNADAVAAVAELRAALRELGDARTQLNQLAAGCREYLTTLGA